MYLWGKSDWPTLSWDEKSLTRLLAEVSREQGRLLGKMEALGFELRSEAHLRTLTEDVVKSSEIEGEKLEPRQVRSSIARRLGMDAGGLVPADRNVEGVVDDARWDRSLCRTSDRRAAIGMAFLAIPDRAKRHDQDPGRKLA